MTSTALRIYTVVVAGVCAVAVVLSLHAQNMASGWRADSRAWKQLVQTTVLHDRAATRQAHQMAIRYNRLIRRTTRSQRRLVAALRRAQTASSTVYAPQSTVYRTVGSSSGGGSTAAASAPVPVSSPAPAPSPPPTTRTS
jgi:hypothetical protein